jgi:KDO2-lipid IV(A) lauroyltransferase
MSPGETAHALGRVPFWKRQRYRLEWFGLKLLSTLVCLLPYRAIRPLASLLGALTWRFDLRRREVSIANLRCAFGDRYQENELSAIGHRSFGVFAGTMLELLWSPRLSRELLKKLGTQETLDPASRHAEQGRAVIYAGLHAGNFEWTSKISVNLFGPVPLIAQELKNPLIGPLIDSWRSVVGHSVCPRKGVMIRMLRHLKEGGKFGVLVDLNLKPADGPVIIRCFGKYLTPVTRLPAELALRTGAAVVPVEIFPREGGGHHLRFLPEIHISESTTPTEIAQACWDALEPGVLKHPELWLWSYKHWRYRPEGPEGDGYPFYASCFPPYQDLLRAQGFAT